MVHSGNDGVDDDIGATEGRVDGADDVDGVDDESSDVNGVNDGVDDRPSEVEIPNNIEGSVDAHPISVDSLLPKLPLTSPTKLLS